MKKIFSAVAALGLVAGVASTAAAVDFSVTGEYSVTGQYLSETTNWGTATGGTAFRMNGVTPFEDGINAAPTHSSDTYWLHTFKILPVMKVNDKITMFSDIRLAYDSVWGSQDDSTTTSGAGTTSATAPFGIPALTHTHTVNSNNNLTNNFDIHKIYMEYMSPIGKFRMGRTPAGAWEGPFLNTDGHADRLIFWPGFVPKPFAAYIFLEKQVEGEGYGNVATSDTDGDMYEIGASWANEKAKVALAWDHYLTRTSTDGLTPADVAAGIPAPYSRDRERIKAFAKVGVGMFYGMGEVSYDFGDWLDFDDAAGTQDIDLDSLAYMAAVGLKMGKFDTHLAWVYAEGDDDATDDEMNAAIAGPAGTGLGADFNPLYIWTGKYTGAFVQNGDWAANPVFTTAGCKVLALFADFQLTDKLGLHGAIASGWADETDAIMNDIDDHYGYEFDLGASYKLMDNLTYDIHLGYMVSGEFFDDIADDSTGAGWDTNDIWLATHSLTMSF